MNSNSPPHWSSDPIEVDRTLDGELPPAVDAERQREIEDDADLRARIEPRRRFLAALRHAGETQRASAVREMPAGLDPRIRTALATADVRRGGVLRWARAAAALLVVGVGVGAILLWPRDQEARAMPPEVLKAVEAAREDLAGTAADPLDPERFPPVRDGALMVKQAVKGDAGVVAKLYRPEDLPSVGYAAVAEEGAGDGPDIGMTDLGDMVVFDILYGRQRHYLAVSSRFLAEQRKLQPGRESCVACHNRSREGKANPHNIVKRSWAKR